MLKVMIAGTKSGVGKTTISMGLMAALSKKYKVQPFKVGPDYIDPAFHSYITGNICSNLDSFLLKEDMIKYLFDKNSRNKDISIVEGVMGLFDGAEVGSDIGTSASIAKILDIPVILVVDGSKVASSLAATVKGFEIFDPKLKVSGVIINNVGSESHYNLLKDAIIYHTGVTPCGYLLKNSKLNLPERHLGLIPACEHNNLDEIFSIISSEITRTVDINLILKLCKEETKKLKFKNIFPRKDNSEDVRIAISRDKAFNFYYQDSLDLLTDYLNVSWVNYSPLTDKVLPPNIHGLYLGGGFPEVFAKEISKNSSMKESILKNLSSGMPYIAECGGLIYLSKSIKDLKGDKHPMIGWLDGKTEMTERLQQFGYGKLQLKEDSVLGKMGESINVHEFHRSKAEISDKQIFQLKKYRKNHQTKIWECGFVKGNGVAGYPHLHFGSNLEMAKAFVESCIAYKRGL